MGITVHSYIHLETLIVNAPTRALSPSHVLSQPLVATVSWKVSQQVFQQMKYLLSSSYRALRSLSDDTPRPTQIGASTLFISTYNQRTTFIPFKRLQTWCLHVRTRQESADLGEFIAKGIHIQSIEKTGERFTETCETTVHILQLVKV